MSKAAVVHASTVVACSTTFKVAATPPAPSQAVTNKIRIECHAISLFCPRLAGVAALHTGCVSLFVDYLDQATILTPIYITDLQIPW